MAKWVAGLAALALVPIGVALAGGLAAAQPAAQAAQPAQPAAEPSAAACDGAPVGIPGTWHCSFDEEFNGSALNTHVWTVQQTANSGFHSGPECFVDTPSTINVSYGNLNLTARKEATPFMCQGPLGVGAYETQYTSGMVSTYKTFNQTYGVFEVRAEIPPFVSRGLQESFWLYPVTAGLPVGPLHTNGEIDIAEMFSQYPSLVIPTIHNNDFLLHPNATNDHCVITDAATSYHTYALVWTPQSMSILYDGQTCLVDNYASQSLLGMQQPFNQPYFISLTQALGIGTNAFDPGTTPLPATTHIDWVRVWS
ncbi:MAG TPA: glycoside hydrolase family 16 protein [Acidimicrobiales bacterium]|nr:glycoside hydrolase family 16 protein [Acidimicrobiales bacterium]